MAVEPRRGVRVPRAQRRREDDDDPHPPRPAASDERLGHDLRARQPARQPRDPRPARQPPGGLRIRPAADRPRARDVPRRAARHARISAGPPSWRRASTPTSTGRSGELSRGNRQKIGLVQAAFHDPELLVLDEPTSGLDPLMQEEFLAFVAEERERGHDDLPLLARARRGPAGLRPRRHHPRRPPRRRRERRRRHRPLVPSRDARVRRARRSRGVPPDPGRQRAQGHGRAARRSRRSATSTS